MKKSVRDKIQGIIETEFMTDWEFILNVIAPEIEEEDFDIDEVSQMLADEIVCRRYKLHSK